MTLRCSFQDNVSHDRHVDILFVMEVCYPPQVACAQHSEARSVPKLLSWLFLHENVLGFEIGTVFLTSSCGILRQLRVHIAKILISFRKCHTVASFRITVLRTDMELQYFFHDDGRKERHAGILLGMELRYASEVECTLDCQPDVLPPNILKFHYAVIQFYRTAVCPPLPGTAQNLFTFFILFVSFLYFISRLQGVKSLKLWSFLGGGGGSAPHTDYILCPFGRTC